MFNKNVTVLELKLCLTDFLSQLKLSKLFVQSSHHPVKQPMFWYIHALMIYNCLLFPTLSIAYVGESIVGPVVMYIFYWLLVISY